MQGLPFASISLAPFLHRDGCSSLESLASRAPFIAVRRGTTYPNGNRPGFLRRDRIAARGRDHGVEYLIRQARITDIDRLAAIGGGTTSGSGSGSLDAADLLRQLVYLPNASLLVAETRREIVGGALLVLRPSVISGGYVGTVDFLVTAPDHDADRVTDALLEELLRSAGNKGCTTVEVAQPTDPARLARLARAGFAPAGPTLRRPLAAAGSTRRP